VNKTYRKSMGKKSSGRLWQSKSSKHPEEIRNYMVNKCLEGQNERNVLTMNILGPESVNS
jgi:hypothetical protein